MGNTNSGTRPSTSRTSPPSSSRVRTSTSTAVTPVFFTSAFSTNHPVSSAPLSTSVPTSVVNQSRAQPIRNIRRSATTNNHSYPSRPSVRRTATAVDRTDHSNPFVITCPYTNCGQRLEAWSFYEHATRLHKQDNQRLVCPICTMEASSYYRVNSNTNLMNHLERMHRHDFRTNYTLEEDEDSDSSLEFRMPTHVGSRYVVDVVKEYVPDVECTICFEEFFPGEKIARLECFCVFHKDCIDSWYLKKIKCPIHVD